MEKKNLLLLSCKLHKCKIKQFRCRYLLHKYNLFRTLLITYHIFGTDSQASHTLSSVLPFSIQEIKNKKIIIKKRTRLWWDWNTSHGLLRRSGKDVRLDTQTSWVRILPNFSLSWCSQTFHMFIIIKLKV